MALFDTEYAQSVRLAVDDLIYRTIDDMWNAAGRKASGVNKETLQLSYYTQMVQQIERWDETLFLAETTVCVQRFPQLDADLQSTFQTFCVRYFSRCHLAPSSSSYVVVSRLPLPTAVRAILCSLRHDRTILHGAIYLYKASRIDRYQLSCDVLRALMVRCAHEEAYVTLARTPPLAHDAAKQQVLPLYRTIEPSSIAPPYPPHEEDDEPQIAPDDSISNVGARPR